MKSSLPLPFHLLLVLTYPYFSKSQTWNRIWPTGTNVTGSTTHATNFVTGNRQVDYFPIYAIDGDNDTFWNDDSLSAWPDYLTISLPNPVTMKGMTLVSHPDGYLTDWSADIFDGSTWVTVASATSATGAVNVVSFTTIKPTTQLRIRVNKGGSTQPNGDYSRIAEVIPVFVDKGSATSTAASSPSPSSSSSGQSSSSTASSGSPSSSGSPGPSSPSKSSINAGAIAGGVIGGVIFIALLTALAFFFGMRHHKKKSVSTAANGTHPEHASASPFHFHSGPHHSGHTSMAQTADTSTPSRMPARELPEYNAELPSQYQQYGHTQGGGYDRGSHATSAYQPSPPLPGAGAGVYDGVPTHPQSPKGLYEVGKAH